MSYLLSALEILVSQIFILSGIAKVFDFDEADTFVKRFAPWNTSRYILIFFIAVEFLLPALLLTPRFAQFATLALVILLIGFCVLIAYSMNQGDNIHCSCFGALSRSKLGWSTLLRNIFLISLLLCIYPLQIYFPQRSLVELLVVGNNSSVPNPFGDLAVLPFLLLFAVQLLQLNRFDVGRRSPTVSSESSEPKLLKPEAGSYAPSFTLINSDGEELSSSDLLSKDKHTAIFFILSDCESCAELLPNIARLQTKLSSKIDTLVVSDGDHEFNLRRANLEGVSNVFLQRKSSKHAIGEVSVLFGVEGYPCHVVLDKNHTIVKETSFGFPDLDKMISQTLSGKAASIVPQDAF